VGDGAGAYLALAVYFTEVFYFKDCLGHVMVLTLIFTATQGRVSTANLTNYALTAMPLCLPKNSRFPFFVFAASQGGS
jgi:hypothetical protein